MIDKLKTFHERVKRLRAAVKAVERDRVGQVCLRKEAESIGSTWCNDLGPGLSSGGGFSVELLDTYRVNFSKLIELSAPNNRKSSYLAALDASLKSFRRDLILPMQEGRVKAGNGGPSSFDSFLARMASVDEGEYFKEALSCAKAGFLRAATVMGWCAAIDRIHQRIEDLGFTKFNVASAQMASQTTGRFKRFTQTQNVNSISELREVFDNIVLWVIEGMGLIDSNQHTRLRSCFEMRCHAAHPGEAPTTEYNLLSFFSDIEQIVLASSKFAIKPSQAPVVQPSKTG